MKTLLINLNLNLKSVFKAAIIFSWPIFIKESEEFVTCVPSVADRVAKFSVAKVGENVLGICF